MACNGLHCSGCAAGAAIPVWPLAAAYGLAWVAEHLVEVIAISATCGVLAVAAVVALMRWTDRRDARHVAERPLLVTREAPASRLTATVTPQVTQGTSAPAVEQHVHFHFDPADREAARIIRQAIPGLAGDVITEHRN